MHLHIFPINYAWIKFFYCPGGAGAPTKPPGYAYEHLLNDWMPICLTSKIIPHLKKFISRCINAFIIIIIIYGWQDQSLKEVFHISDQEVAAALAVIPANVNQHE